MRKFLIGSFISLTGIILIIDLVVFFGACYVVYILLKHFGVIG